MRAVTAIRVVIVPIRSSVSTSAAASGAAVSATAAVASTVRHGRNWFEGATGFAICCKWEVVGLLVYAIGRTWRNTEFGVRGCLMKESEVQKVEGL